ncbi:MAG: hypothetical protein IMW97_02610 [Firmicutes bacterium]|nr:hypothetical protein [Candidatus Fermentithermobacillaceae bacterium]
MIANMIGNLTLIKPTAYQRYVEPKNPRVRELATLLDIRGECLALDLVKVVEWARGNIELVRFTPDLRTVATTLENSAGSCFSIACVICSVLRSPGLREIYVAVVRMKNRPFDSMLHAVVVAYEGGTTYVADPIGDVRYLCTSDSGLPWQLYGDPLLVFNDACSYFRTKA